MGWMLGLPPSDGNQAKVGEEKQRRERRGTWITSQPCGGCSSAITSGVTCKCFAFSVNPDVDGNVWLVMLLNLDVLSILKPTAASSLCVVCERVAEEDPARKSTAGYFSWWCGATPSGHQPVTIISAVHTLKSIIPTEKLLPLRRRGGER